MDVNTATLKVKNIFEKELGSFDVGNFSSKKSAQSKLVSIPPGKYLFSFRTQKSSLVGAIILLCGKLARCQFMIKSSFTGGFFLLSLFGHCQLSELGFAL